MRCLKNVIIGNFFQDSKLEHIVSFVHKTFCRFWYFLDWIHFPRIDSNTFWNCNCDFFVVDCWELRDLNHTIGDFTISYKITYGKLYFESFYKLTVNTLDRIFETSFNLRKIANVGVISTATRCLKIYFRILSTFSANQRVDNNSSAYQSFWFLKHTLVLWKVFVFSLKIHHVPCVGQFAFPLTCWNPRRWKFFVIEKEPL